MSDDIDEVALNAMLAEGIEPAVTVVASVRDPKPPGNYNGQHAYETGLVLGVVVGIIGWLAWLAQL